MSPIVERLVVPTRAVGVRREHSPTGLRVVPVVISALPAAPNV
ncbi:hypothetical protein ACH4TV_07805 [Streptomyces sp. NPDC020898]